MVKRSLLLFVFFLFSQEVWGLGQVRYLPRSPYALLMGDAFTARADDSYTLFYNPAALSKNKGVEFYTLGFSLGATNVLSDLDRFNNLSSDPVELSSTLTGFPIYIHAGGAPTLKFGPIGFTLFANLDSSMIMRNSVHPSLQVDHRYDRGFILGYAHTFGKGSFFEQKRSREGANTTVAFAVKHMNREGVKKSYDIFGTGLLSDITSGSFSGFDDFKTVLGFSEGDGWGWDVAALHSYTSGSSELSFGLVLSDVNGTSFKLTSGTNELPEQDMMVAAGVNYQFKTTLFDFSLSMDYKPAFADIPFARKLHFGMDVGIPFVRMLLGFNEGYVSYGVKLNMWPFTLTAGFYGVELGHDYRQLQGKRIIIYLSLLDFSFDA